MATVQIDNRQVAAASHGGRYAAVKGLHPASCPYTGNDPDTAALRRVWVSAYLHQNPPTPGRVSYDE